MNKVGAGGRIAATCPHGPFGTRLSPDGHMSHGYWRLSVLESIRAFLTGRGQYVECLACHERLWISTWRLVVNLRASIASVEWRDGRP